MSKLDTSMGGNRDAFPETAWSAFLSTGGSISPDQRDAFRRLCTLYWRPVYKYVRATWGKSVDDAKEITQGIFCDLLARAIARLKGELEREGKREVFAAYEAFELHPPDAARPSHEEIARRLGTSATQVNNHLHAARIRLRQLILDQISQYSASREE